MQKFGKINKHRLGDSKPERQCQCQLVHSSKHNDVIAKSCKAQNDLDNEKFLQCLKEELSLEEDEITPWY